MTRRSLAELVENLGIDRDFVAELERESIVVLTDDSRVTLERIRICWNLHDELGVNLAGIEIVLHLLDRLEGERHTHLERLRRLRAMGAEDILLKGE